MAPLTPWRAVLLVASIAVLLVACALLLGELLGRDSGRATARFLTLPSIVAEPTPTPSAVAATATATPHPIQLSALGDSVMLAAADLLRERFPGAVIDAAVGRTVPEALAILRQWVADDRLGDVVLVHIGNNGPFNADELEEVIRLVGPGRVLVLVNLTVPKEWEKPNNQVIADGAARHGGIAVVDWHAVTVAHPELLWDDGVHLRPAGAEAYADLITPYLRR